MQTLEVNRIAELLLDAWKKADPKSSVALHPTSYVATFADMAKAIIEDRNTRPGAPVEGLVRYHTKDYKQGMFEALDGEYVLFSQAEAVIAEKDEEIALANASRDEWGKIAYAAGYYQAECSLPEHETAAEALSEYRQLKADNAALTARVKELEGERDEAIRRGEDQWTGWVKEEVLRKALEIQLAAANKRADELEAAWLKAEALLSEYQP